MFRMKFQTRDTAAEDEEIGVQERYRERTAESVGCSSASDPAVIFEGGVGKFGKIQRFPNPDKAVAHHGSSLGSLTLSSNVATTGSENSADGDLEGPVQEVPHYAIIFDVDVLQDPVKPFAESLHVRLQGYTKESLSDKNVIVTNIHYQTSVRRQDADMDCVSSPAPALGEARTFCVQSAPPDADSECCSSYMNEGKIRREHENKSVTGMTNKLLQQRKNNEPSGHDDRFAKPWEKPLLAAHDQAELDLIAKQDAQVEAERLSEEERRNCQRQQRELRDLASCVSTGTPGDSFRKSKLQKILRFLQIPFRVLRSQKTKHDGYPLARVAKVVNPNARLFRGCRIVPSGPPDSVLASMRNSSEKSISGSHIQFAKVDSTNRDVPAWTREEYLRRNGKIPDRWNVRKDDEEFGGTLGNNYLNNYVVAGMTGGVYSDSDSDSD